MSRVYKERGSGAGATLQAAFKGIHLVEKGKKEKKKKQTTTPVSVLIRPLCILSHFPQPPLWSERLLAGPLIRSGAVIIGLLRSQKDTQHVVQVSQRVDFQVNLHQLLRLLYDGNKLVLKDTTQCRLWNTKQSRLLGLLSDLLWPHSSKMLCEEISNRGFGEFLLLMATINRKKKLLFRQNIWMNGWMDKFIAAANTTRSWVVIKLLSVSISSFTLGVLHNTSLNPHHVTDCGCGHVFSMSSPQQRSAGWWRPGNKWKPKQEDGNRVAISQLEKEDKDKPQMMLFWRPRRSVWCFTGKL